MVKTLKEFKTRTQEGYTSNLDISIGDRLDMINDEIENCLSIINDSDDLDEKVSVLAELINQARFYTSFVAKKDIAEIMDRLESR